MEKQCVVLILLPELNLVTLPGFQSLNNPKKDLTLPVSALHIISHR